jgi:beta-glucosidase
MCAYNRTNGEPCCSNDRLLEEILRKEWGFDGYTVSDCGAITDIYRGHHTVDSVEKASAIAVKAGTDLSCGREYGSLMNAVKAGLVTVPEIDKSVKRLMTARFRLGMFDPPEMVPYARIPLSENDTSAHRRLALEAARESIVLLKNQNGTLPLKKDLKTIAVIGPNADASEVLLGNYSGQPSVSVTPLAGIKQKVSPQTRVIYVLGANFTGEEAGPVPASVLSLNGNGSNPGFKGEYFNNEELDGQPVMVRTDEQVNFDWARGRAAPQVNEDGFSVRWTGKFTPPESGKYRLGLIANDGVRLYLDGKPLIDAWVNNQTNQAKTVMKEVSLEGRRSYDVRIEFYDHVGAAIAKFVWSFDRFNERLKEEAVQAARQADAVIAVLGITPSLEGEEMNVQIEGFRGGDRTDIALPKAQQDLLQAVSAVGKPVVLVLLNGSALAVNWADEHVPAIVEAWYPGEEGGSALADVLFGDYNPAGRLPVTFYKSVAQLPPFEDYRMAGRTYRYFKGEPRYPFGYGLSYTKFEYSDLLLRRQVKAGDEVEVKVRVKNVGPVEGDEVVQLYVRHLSAKVPVPIRSLEGFKRVHLKAGASTAVEFKLSARQLSLIDDRLRRVVEPGEIEISVGGGQPGQRPGASNVLLGKLRVTGDVFPVR